MNNFQDNLLTIIIWTGMAYWTAKIASRKNRSIPLAVFLALIFGIFAVIGYYIIRPNKNHVYNNFEE